MDKIGNIDNQFLGQVINEYRELEPDGKIFIRVGEQREVRRSVSNDYLDVIVLNEQEKEIIENMCRLERKKSIQPSSLNQKEPEQRVKKLVSNLNDSEKTTREGIKTVKKSNTKVKRNLKNSFKKIINKVYKMVPKTKEELKEFLKEKGIKIGVGITALVLMGVIVSSELSERAENIQRYNNEFTSIEQVEEQIKGIIDAEIIEAIEHSGLETEELNIDINRLEAYREDAEGVEVVIRGLKANYDKEMVLRERKGLDGGNMPESLEDMAESYLQVQEMSDSNMKDRHKNKAIKLLEKVEKIASRKDLKIRESKVPDFLRSSGKDYVMKETREDGDGDER